MDYVEIDINTLLVMHHQIEYWGYGYILNINQFQYYHKNFKLVGKINDMCCLLIDGIYKNLDLSLVDCDMLSYIDQKNEDIKNHILPNKLKKLIITMGDDLT